MLVMRLVPVFFDKLNFIQRYCMKKTIKFAALAAGLASLILSGCPRTTAKGEYTIEEGKLKIAMEIGYPPFEYYAGDGKTPVGFDVELGKAISEKLGLKAEFIDTSWDGILGGLDTGRYDVIMSAMTITDERKQNYTFSTPYIGNGQAIILRKDSPLVITGPEDLAGLKVGYQAETTSDFYLEKYAAEHNFTYVQGEYDKVMNAYADLKFGRIDAVISDSLVAVDYLGAKDSEFKQVWNGTPDEYFGICMKKGNEKLAEKIEGALSTAKEDGTLSEICEKIFGMDLAYTVSNAQ